MSGRDEDTFYINLNDAGAGFVFDVSSGARRP